MACGKKRYEGMRPADMRRMKLPEDENAKLRKLVADLPLDKEMLSGSLGLYEGGQPRLLPARKAHEQRLHLASGKTLPRRLLKKPGLRMHSLFTFL